MKKLAFFYVKSCSAKSLWNPPERLQEKENENGWRSDYEEKKIELVLEFESPVKNIQEIELKNSGSVVIQAELFKEPNASGESVVCIPRHHLLTENGLKRFEDPNKVRSFALGPFIRNWKEEAVHSLKITLENPFHETCPLKMGLAYLKVLYTETPRLSVLPNLDLVSNASKASADPSQMIIEKNGSSFSERKPLDMSPNLKKAGLFEKRGLSPSQKADLTPKGTPLKTTGGLLLASKGKNEPFSMQKSPVLTPSRVVNTIGSMPLINKFQKDFSGKKEGFVLAENTQPNTKMQLADLFKNPSFGLASQQIRLSQVEKALAAKIIKEKESEEESDEEKEKEKKQRENRQSGEGPLVRCAPMKTGIKPSAAKRRSPNTGMSKKEALDEEQESIQF